MRDRLRLIDQEAFDPSNQLSRGVRLLLLLFMVAMLCLAVVIWVRGGITAEAARENWWRAAVIGLIPIVGAIAGRWARR